MSSHQIDLHFSEDEKGKHHIQVKWQKLISPLKHIKDIEFILLYYKFLKIPTKQANEYEE